MDQCRENPTPPPILALRHVTKEFGGVRVLDRVSLDLHPGEVLGLVGENGAGKSTLLHIVGGVYAPSEGEVHIDGQRVDTFSPRVARQKGVALIPQERNLAGDLSVAANIFLGREPVRRFGRLDERAMARRARELLDLLHAGHIDPAARIDTLSPAERQLVEIAKALAFDHARVVIMDEPSTVLNPPEVETLFAVIRRLRGRGVAVVYVSHRLREVKAVTDRVLVLRDGQAVLLDPTRNLDEAALAAAMAGRALTRVFPPKTTPSGPVALRVDGLADGKRLHGISFAVRQGEILGLAGLMGAGRTETAEAIIGLRPRHGTVDVHGRPLLPERPADAVAAGIAYLSEDRQGTGLLVHAGLVENVTLASLGRYVRRGLVRQRARREATQRYVDEFSIRAADLSADLEFFSGGNQQKAALAKCLDTVPKVVIFDEPTRGIDLRAKTEFYAFIRRLADDGLACVLISGELEEIVGLCHRVAVLHEGRLAGLLEGDAVHGEEIMLHATGLKTTPPGIRA